MAAKGKLSPEQESQLRALFDRIMLTIDFSESVGGFRTAALPDMLRKSARQILDEGDLRDMRRMAREIDEASTFGLPPRHREGLEAMLASRLGVDADAERAEMRAKAAAAIKRGKVGSEKERRRLEDYAEMLEATGGDPEEIAAVRRLIGA
ncbi:MAG TPA: hypothetical protein VFA43_17110 [Gemmatimonadaceae bacterium]|nr:hypothetical protein [Gemmatimonadaceae bacterium]